MIIAWSHKNSKNNKTHFDLLMDWYSEVDFFSDFLSAFWSGRWSLLLECWSTMMFNLWIWSSSESSSVWSNEFWLCSLLINIFELASYTTRLNKIWSWVGTGRLVIQVLTLLIPRDSCIHFVVFFFYNRNHVMFFFYFLNVLFMLIFYFDQGL